MVSCIHCCVEANFLFCRGGEIFLPSRMAFANLSLDMCAESVSDMSAANNTAVAAGCTPRFLSPFSIADYLRRWSSRFDAHRLAIIPAGLKLAVMVGRVESEMAYEGWRCRWE